MLDRWGTETGTQINENYAIRTFSIWTNHVFHGTANATSHEIWIEPVSRFVGTLSLFLRSPVDISD